MIQLIKWVLLTIIGLLPDSPFTSVIDGLSVDGFTLEILNWFLPLDITAVMFVAWVQCMVLYLVFVIVKEIGVKLILKKITGLIGVVGSFLSGG